MIVGEAWGQQEERRQAPFVGQTGEELSKLMAETGISRRDCFITNVVAARPPYNELLWWFEATATARKQHVPALRGLYPKQIVLDGLTALYAQIKLVKPKLIIALGNYPLWALTESDFRITDKSGHKVPTGIGLYRGSMLRTPAPLGNIPLLPTYHPAAIFRTWKWRSDIKHDLQARVPLALSQQWTEPNRAYVTRPSFEQVMAILAELAKRAEVGPIYLSEDIETYNEHITCIGYAWSSCESLCIPFTDEHGSYWSEEQETEIILTIRQLHSNPNIKTLGMNFLYDAQYIALYWGYKPTCFADIMILHHLIWPDKPKSLNYISSLYNAHHVYWKDEGHAGIGKVLGGSTFSFEQHWQYNCKDALATFEAWTHLDTLIERLGLQEQAIEQMRLFDIVLDMMLRGVRIDLERRKAIHSDLTAMIENRRSFLENVIDPTVWPRKKGASPWYTSPKQQCALFYDVLGLPEIKRRGKKGRAGPRTCNDDALGRIGKREPVLRPIVTAIQELRSLRIFLKNFVDAELELDNRIRCSFDITGTRTFRWSSSTNAFGRGTNLQTIPKGSEEAPD